MAGLAVYFYLSANLWVWLVSFKSMVEPAQAKPADAIIILGAYVRPDGALSWILRDRLDTGLELYRAGLAPKILVSGDHGQKNYNEVQTMKDYLLDHDVPAQDIFMDHAGFDTYDSLYRARDIFQVKSAIIVTQNFHLPRALYIARRLGNARIQARLYYPYANTIRDLWRALKPTLMRDGKSKLRHLGVISISGGRVTQNETSVGKLLMGGRFAQENIFQRLNRAQ